MKSIRAFAVFLVVLAICLFIIWLEGFNFDHRGEDVARLFVGSILLSGYCAFCAWLFSDSD